MGQKWLMKSEPNAYSIDDLVKDKKIEGINDIKDEMKNQNINREIYRTGEMNF